MVHHSHISNVAHELLKEMPFATVPETNAWLRKNPEYLADCDKPDEFAIKVNKQVLSFSIYY